MGTRSLTILKDLNGNDIVVMYRQFDGYIKGGHGEELANLLTDITLVNGIPMGTDNKIANGMECLSATIVAHFKTNVGGIYLHPANTNDIGEEFTYILSGKIGDKIKIRIKGWKGKELFNGYVHELKNDLKTNRFNQEDE